MLRISFFIALSLLISCGEEPHVSPAEPVVTDTSSAITKTINVPADTAIAKNTTRDELVAFAETLKGVSYHEAGANPATGFDCSGFITYVFNHFDITVPRSSVDFTNVGKEVSVQLAKRGDLILFTGTDSSIRIVGHMGIVTENTDSLWFIHSTSGKKYGVTVTTFNEYYKGRFVKVVDVW